VFQVLGTEQVITLTVAANTPSAFTFTDISNASLATLYTSNTITIAGLTGGVSVPVSITGGTYSKNGGAYTSAAGTAVNGDTFAVQVTSSASNNANSNVVLTVGATSDTYTVSTPVVLTTTSAWNSADRSGTTISGADSLTITGTGGSFGTYTGARGTVSKSSGKRWIEWLCSVGNTGSNEGVGVAKAAATLSAQLGIADTNAAIYYNKGFLAYNGQPATGLATYQGTTDIVGMVIDIDNGQVTIFKNGVLQATLAVPALQGQALFPAFSTEFTPTFVMNTGHSAAAYTYPGSPIAWDT